MEDKPKKKRASRTDPETLRERYAEGRAAGKTQRKALVDAMADTPTCKDKCLDERACLLEAEPKVKQRIEAIKARTAAGLTLSRDDLAAFLADFAADTDKSDGIRLKAADQLARMIGAYDDHSSLTISGGILTGKDKAAAIKDYLAGLRDSQ